MKLNNLSPKEEAMICHKLAAIFTIAADDMAEFLPNSPLGKQIKERADEMVPVMEAMLANIYTLPELYSGTYLNDLSKKVETVIRKNFQ